MKSDLSCPLELWEYKLPDESGGECTLHIFNLENKVLSSVQVRLTLFGKRGEQLSSHVERPMALDAPGKLSFTVAFALPKCDGLESASVLFEKAWFEDGSIWRRATVAQLAEYVPNELPPGRGLENLRYVAGPDAVGYPSNQGDIWLCVCGRPNRDDEDVCRRCGRSREYIFLNSSKQAVAEAIESRERELERKAVTIRDNIAREQLLNQNNRVRREVAAKGRWTGAVYAAALIAVLYALMVVITPMYQYSRASKALDSENTSVARRLFTELMDYKDSPEKRLQCDLTEAKALLKDGDKQKVADAISILEGLGDYKDASETYKSANYQQATVMMEYGEYEKASAIFEGLGAYQNSRDLRRLAEYRIATRQLNAGDYSYAYEKFMELGNYEDSADLALQSVYRPAEQAMNAKRYDEAAELYARIPDYMDAAGKEIDCLYQAAVAHYLAGRYLEARERFAAVGDYKDSRDMLTESTYCAAIELRDTGKYSEAVKLLGEIPDYKDAQSLVASCSYEPAKAYMAAFEYDKAAALLSVIRDYEDAGQLLLECSYLPASEAYRKSDWKSAASLFAKTPGYKDSSEMLLACKYNIAMQTEESGELNAAVSLYREILEYKDSAQRANNCEYTIASHHFIAGEYDAAQSRFTSLGDFSDSRVKALECQYEKACLIRDAGDKEGARTAFLAIKDYPRAADAAGEMSYSLAEDELYNSNLLKAAEYFAQAGNYKDAAKQRLVCIYAEAMKWMNAFDYQQAGDLFDSIPDYNDSKQKSAECYDLWLKDKLAEAKKLERDGKLREAADLLGELPIDSLPSSYAEMKSIYARVNLRIAEELIDAEKTLEAYAYLKKAEALTRAKELLGKRIYALLGEWQNPAGGKFAFYTDYTCVIDGETGLYFDLSGYGIKTGPSRDSLKETYRLTSYDNDITMRDGNNKVVRLKRTSGNVNSGSPQTETPAPDDEE